MAAKVRRWDSKRGSRKVEVQPAPRMRRFTGEDEVADG